LNTAEALAAIFEYVREVNTSLDGGEFQEENRWDAAHVLEVFDGVFDVLKRSDRAEPMAEKNGSGELRLSDIDIHELNAERNQAKKSRNFMRADEIRKSLQGKGIILEDTKE